MIARTSSRRRRVDRAVTVLSVFAVLLALTPLVWILIDVVKTGIGAIHGLSFLTQAPPGDPSSTAGGIANGILGTLIMLGVAIVMAVPVGVLGAIYLVEFAPASRFSAAVRFFADVMSGVPSIVFGIFVYSVIVATTKHYSAIAGSIAIALIMWPIILRSTEEILKLVPEDLRLAAHALGSPRWRTTLQVVLPAAAGGILTGAMLGVARASGETAPLLFTALGNQFVSTRLDKPISALPLEIFRGALTVFEQANQRAWAAALTLIVFVLALSLGGRALVARRERALR